MEGSFGYDDDFFVNIFLIEGLNKNLEYVQFLKIPEW